MHQLLALVVTYFDRIQRILTLSVSLPPPLLSHRNHKSIPFLHRNLLHNWIMLVIVNHSFSDFFNPCSNFRYPCSNFRCWCGNFVAAAGAGRHVLGPHPTHPHPLGEHLIGRRPLRFPATGKLSFPNKRLPKLAPQTNAFLT